MPRRRRFMRPAAVAPRARGNGFCGELRKNQGFMQNKIWQNDRTVLYYQTALCGQMIFLQT